MPSDTVEMVIDTESDLDDEDFVVGNQLTFQLAEPEHDLAQSATQPENDNNTLKTQMVSQWTLKMNVRWSLIAT